MTLPEILALEPAQVRVMVAEAVGWKRIDTKDDPDSMWPKCVNVSTETHGLMMPPVGDMAARPPGYCTDLNSIAQAVAGLKDEEHERYRLALWEVVNAANPWPEGMRHSEYKRLLDRAYIDAPALQRARAFLCAKSE